MGVYIKGMEMPKSCSECRFFVDAWCYAFKADDWRNAYNKPPNGERLDNCPLFPVPPHGRLIDADVLRCLYDPHDYGLDGEQADEYDRYHVSLPVIRQNIDDMPTIIPAEEGE